MTTRTRLFGNLGGEEGPHWRASAEDPRVAKARSLWALLFSPGTPFFDGEAIARWPRCLGTPRPGAAFDWLEPGTGLIPWLSTDEARDRAKSENVPFLGAPPEIVSRVHDKAFSQEVARRSRLLPSELEDCIAILNPGDFSDRVTATRRISEHIANWPAWATRSFTLKPRLGSSGRRRIPGSQGAVNAAALEGALGYMRECGGAVLEPWLDRAHDLSAQLHVGADGPPLLLGTLEQIATPSGLYRGHRGWADARGRIVSGLEADEAVREAAAELAKAAHEHGYTGPAGLDAMLFHPPAPSRSDTALRAVTEFNARFTMGTVVMGLVRAAIAVIRQNETLHPERRLAFLFLLDAPPGGWTPEAYKAEPGTHWFPLWEDDEEAQAGLLLGERPIHHG